MPEVLTAAEAAAILRVSPRTVERLAREGKLRRVPHLRAVRIPAAALREMVERATNDLP